MKSYQVRQAFIDFFKSKEHIAVSAAPVVPHNDPTLLFTNAGMNQFKPYFLGTEIPKNRRVVNAQPCIRVSGKHNDLDDVGFDTYHHTSFEMLGNWSFGDYYKKEAIQWAWELLTTVYKLPKEHLLATVYEDDPETAQLWRDCTDIKPEHIVMCGKKDNFWEMGATGPCGPCSEIHLDLTPELGVPVQQEPDTKGLTTRYMELWNLVFIQYDRQADGSMIDLPECHVDTGAGLERLTAQLQGVRSNYDTDCFQHIIQEVADHLGVPYGDGPEGIPHRVIADHIRTVSFAIADNVLPSNEGRGYVLRRLIRRALRFAAQAGKNSPFLYSLIPGVHSAFGGHYTHIGERVDYIAELVKAEETQFLRTVSSGLGLFQQVVADVKAANTSTITGDTAFKLYDTYGFPLDLTQVMAQEHALTVDVDGFDTALNAQRERSRAARTETLSNGKDATILAVSNTVEPVHQGVYIDQPGGGEARIPASLEQRFGMAQHHTATHLLHQALQKVVGSHVKQAGSLVDINRLRFDFTAKAAVSAAELTEVTDMVNTWITEAHAINITEEPIADAKARGAHAMFGEKYGDTVRVVDIPNVSIELCGGNHVKNTQDIQIVHIVAESAVAAGVRRLEAIVGQERVAEFHRAACEKKYTEYAAKYKDCEAKFATLGDASPEPLPTLLNKETATLPEITDGLRALMGVGKRLDKALQQQQQSAAGDLLSESLAKQCPLNGETGVGVFYVYHNQPIPVLRDLADRLVDTLGDAVVVLGSSINNKGHAVAKVSPSLVNTLGADRLIKALTTHTGGGGGGQAKMAQAGGLDASKLEPGMAARAKEYGT